MLVFNTLALLTALGAFSASASPIPAGALLSGLEANTLPSSVEPPVSTDNGLDRRILLATDDAADASASGSIIKRLNLVPAGILGSENAASNAGNSATSILGRQLFSFDSETGAESHNSATLIKRLNLVPAGILGSENAASNAGDGATSILGRQLFTFDSETGAESHNAASLFKRLDLVSNNAAGANADNSADLAKRVVLAGAAGATSDADLSPSSASEPGSASLTGRDTTHELYIDPRGELKADAAAGADWLWK